MATNELRMIRGYEILAKGDKPKQLDEQTFRIPSQSGNGDYLILKEDDDWKCNCPDHHYRKVECKHIHAVKLWLAIKEKIDSDKMGEVVEKAKCPLCKSQDVIMNGNRKTRVGKRQRYKCNKCGRTFMVDEAFKRIVGDPKLVSLSLDLYFKGISLRKICDHISQFYGMKIHYSTIYNWIKRYMNMIEAYVQKLEPNLSKIWRADEMMVKVGGKWHWLWNLMDDETRFLLASQISKTRNFEDARRVFAKAKVVAKAMPDTIITDGLPSYMGAYITSPEDMNKVQHVRHIRLSGYPNNNKIERLQGTKRERTKVMRGLKTDQTPTREGFDIYYNYIRPHQGLNGKTPAEVAGIDLNIRQNKWLSLIRKSVNNASF